MKMDSKKCLSLVQKIDDLIKDTHFDQAIDVLQKLSPEDIPKIYRVQFAGLAKRLGLPQLGIKFIWKQVYEEKDSSPELLLELGSCLRKMNLCHQGLKWLERLPASPDVLRELAFVHIHLWNYEIAKKILVELLQNKKIRQQNSYPAILVNLAACHLYLEEFDEAIKLIEEVETNKGFGNNQLYLNAGELRAQSFLQLGHAGKAEKHIENAISALKSRENLTYLLLKKWHVVAKMRQGNDGGLAKEIDEVRALARRIGNWETLRDLDYQIGLLNKDGALLTKVYFGTPFDSFKRRMRDKLNYPPTTSYIWRDSRTQDPTVVADCYFEVGSKLGFGLTEHRLFLLLLSDFYRPFDVARVFDGVYADEIYNPFTSDNRVHTLVSSLRKSLDHFKIPALITSTPSGYRLRPTEKLCFRIYDRMTFASTEEAFTAFIEQCFGSSSFSRLDLEEKMGVSSDQGNRHIKSLISLGFLSKMGRGKATRYLLQKGTPSLRR